MSAMLTDRKIFSVSLTASAISGDRDPNRLCDEFGINSACKSACLGTIAAHDFWNSRRFKFLIAGVFAFWRKGEKEVAAR